MTRAPVLKAIIPRSVAAAPVALGNIARAGEAEHISRMGAVAKDAAKRGMYAAAALAVAPVRHDDRTGNQPGALLTRPARRLQKLLRLVGLPIREQQLGFRRQRVHDLPAENAMLTVLGLQVAVSAKGVRHNPRRQCLAQLLSITTETGVENGHLHSAAEVPGPMPLAHTQPQKLLGAPTDFRR